jgi:membrane protein YqaA with SNARE-associated domain/molybdopterin converting factor small subunit
MAVIWIPSLLRKLTNGADEVTVDATTVRAAIDALDAQFPGIKERLVLDDRLRPSFALVIDGVTSHQGLRQALSDTTEVHFVPAMSGGSGDITPAVPNKLRAALPLIVAIVITLIAFGLGFYFRAQILALGQYGLIGVFLINLINNATVILPAPFGLVVACLFAESAHFLIVGLAAGLGSGLGEYTAYMAGAGGNAVLPHGRIYTLMQDYMRRYGAIFIFVLSAIPNPLFDIGGLIAGALKMPQVKFLAATIGGKIIRYALIAYGCSGGFPWLRTALGA